MLRWRLALMAAVAAFFWMPLSSVFAQVPVPIGSSGQYTSPNAPLPPGAMPSGMMPMPMGPEPSAPPALDPFLYTRTGFPIPNAFEDGGLKKSAALVQIKQDFMAMWLRAQRLPTTITSGNPLDPVPGALDQPGTVILNSGDQSYGRGFGSRTYLTYWLADPELLSIDSNFFIMETRRITKSFFSDDAGNPLITRPYLNTALVIQDADPRAVPAVLHGSASDIMTANMMGAEANLKLCLNGGSYNNDNLCGPSIYVIAGARWFQLNERFQTDDNANDIPAGAGFNRSFRDDFQTYNKFIGGQLGAQTRFRWWRFTADLIGKCAFGPNFETANIRGQTIQSDAAGNAIVDQQGFYAQFSNIGRYTKTTYSFIPEGQLNVGFDINDHIRFTAGWSVLAFTQVLRPEGLINTNINIQPLQAAQFNAAIPPFDPGRPNLSQSNIWTHWLSFGFELVY